MAHQTPHASKATAQNAATEPAAPRVQGAHGSEAAHSTRPEPGAYVASDARDASLAPPASGEVGDYADDGDPFDERFGEVQMGGDRNNIANKDAAFPQGRKTVEGNRARVQRRPGTEGAR